MRDRLLIFLKLFTESIYKNWLYQRYQHLAIPQEISFLLESLRKKFQIALVTNGPSAAQWEKIDKLDLRDCFDLILVSGEFVKKSLHQKSIDCRLDILLLNFQEIYHMKSPTRTSSSKPATTST